MSNPYYMQSTKAAGKKHWTSLKQMKAAKKPIKSGITGTGGNMFTISVLSAKMVGYPIDLIPGFKGPELIAGIIRGDFAFTNLPLVTRWTTAVQSGEANAVAVYLSKRHPMFPNIPTGVEQGFPELGSPTLVGHTLYALPPKTPPEIASVLEAALVKANNDTKTKDRIENQRQHRGAVERQGMQQAGHRHARSSGGKCPAAQEVHQVIPDRPVAPRSRPRRDRGATLSSGHHPPPRPVPGTVPRPARV